MKTERRKQKNENKRQSNILSSVFCHLSSEKGIALVMVLILSAIALAIMTGLVYMITTRTQLSGMEKRYTTALEAGKGGMDATFQLLAARGNPNISICSLTISSACLTDKLNKSTRNWTGCNNSLTITPGTTSTYDMYCDLGSSPYPTYRAYSKIVDTVEGNSGADTGLIGQGVVASGSGEVQVVSKPYLYTIEIDAEGLSNPSERSKLSVLYRY